MCLLLSFPLLSSHLLFSSPLLSLTYTLFIIIIRASNILSYSWCHDGRDERMGQRHQHVGALFGWLSHASSQRPLFMAARSSTAYHSIPWRSWPQLTLWKFHGTLCVLPIPFLYANFILLFRLGSLYSFPHWVICGLWPIKATASRRYYCTPLELGGN